MRFVQCMHYIWSPRTSLLIQKFQCLCFKLSAILSKVSFLSLSTQCIYKTTLAHFFCIAESVNVLSCGIQFQCISLQSVCICGTKFLYPLWALVESSRGYYFCPLWLLFVFNGSHHLCQTGSIIFFPKKEPSFCCFQSLFISTWGQYFCPYILYCIFLKRWFVVEFLQQHGTFRFFLLCALQRFLCK